MMNENFSNNWWMLKNKSIITAQRLYDNRHIIDWNFATWNFGELITEDWLNPNEPDSLYFYIDWYHYSLRAPKLTYNFIMDNLDKLYYPRLRDNICNSITVRRYQDIFRSLYRDNGLGRKKVHRYTNELQNRIDSNYALFCKYMYRISEIELDADIALSFQELHTLNNELMSILNSKLLRGTPIQYKYYNIVSDLIDIKYDITYISNRTKRYRINVIA